jgi:hypothetical protein
MMEKEKVATSEEDREEEENGGEQGKGGLERKTCEG